MNTKKTTARVSDFPFSGRFKDKPEVKIKFLHGTPKMRDTLIFLNLAPYDLKSYHEHYGSSQDKLIWLPVEHELYRYDTEFIDDLIREENPDILCFGLYVWNEEIYSIFGRYIKSRYPDIMLIGGGASVYPHTDDGFWKRYDFFDVVIYGEGEEAFSKLLDCLAGVLPEDEQLFSLSYHHKDAVLLPYKRFINRDFNQMSYVIDQKDEIRSAVEIIKARNPGIDLNVSWEYTDGCPYACTFCDWNGNLHNKITRKSYDYKMDLDFLCSLDCSVLWNDANVGQYDDDINIMRYGLDLQDINPNFRLYTYNWAKLRKTNVAKMYEMIEQRHPGTDHKISFQDIDTSVLTAIDRPSVSFKEHVEIASGLRNKFPNINFVIELMYALPDQSLASFGKTMALIIKHIKPTTFENYWWQMLPNSPAYSQGYQERYGIKSSPTVRLYQVDPEIRTRQEFKQDLNRSIWYKCDFVTQTNAADLPQILAMMGMGNLFNNIRADRNRHLDDVFVHRLFIDEALWNRVGSFLYESMLPGYEEDGYYTLGLEHKGSFIPFGSWFDDRENMIKIIKKTF